MAASVETLPGPARPVQDEQRDPRIVPRRIVHLSDDRTIAYAETGSGPDLVAIHGTLMCLEDLWLGPVPALAEHFRVIAVDRPGHGFSLRPRGRAADLWDQAARIREAVQRLGLHRPVILGHSFGGAVALAYGVLHPDEIAGVVAVAPICFPEPRLEQALFGFRAVPGAGDTLALLLSGLLDPVLLPILWRAIFLPQAVPEDFARRFPWERASGAARMIAEGEDSMSLTTSLIRAISAYGSCRVPVRILGGSADIVVNNALHGWAASTIMPSARFDWVFGAGHMLHHFHQDRIVAEVEGLAATA